MTWLRNLVYLTLLVLATPYLVWRSVRTGRYRRGWEQKLLGNIPAPKHGLNGTRRRIWLHAVSLGEVNLISPLIDQLCERLDNVDVLITTTTDTGYDQATARFPQHTVAFLPLDFSWAVKRAMSCWQPDLLVLSELEIWPNLIAAAKQNGTQVAAVNARLSDKSFRGYQRLRWWLKSSFASLDLVAAQTQDYADRFAAMGTQPTRATVAGNMKFDVARRGNPQVVADLRKRFDLNTNPRPVLVAGSTQAEDEHVAFDAFDQLKADFPTLQLVVVPRHPERAGEVEKELATRNLTCFRTSQASADHHSGDVLIVDTIGQLMAWWEIADVAFVGGSFGKRGGQNMLEPACCGKAVCFGPKTRNFRDVVQLLIAADGAYVVHSAEDLANFAAQMLGDDLARTQIGERAAALVQQHQGATSRVATALLQMLGETTSRADSRAA